MRRGNWAPRRHGRLSRFDRLGEKSLSERFYRKSEPLPLVVAAAQGADALDAQLVQGHGGFGGGGLAGAGAEEHDVAVAGNLVMALGQRLRREMERAGQCERIGQPIRGDGASPR